MPSIVFSCMFAPFPLRRHPAAGSGSVKTAAAVLPDRRGRFSAAQPSTSAAADAPGSSCKVGLLTRDREQTLLRSRLPSQFPNGGLSSSAAARPFGGLSHIQCRHASDSHRIPSSRGHWCQRLRDTMHLFICRHYSARSRSLSIPDGKTLFFWIFTGKAVGKILKSST